LRTSNGTIVSAAVEGASARWWCGVQLNAMAALHPLGVRDVDLPRSAERDSRRLRLGERAGSR